MDAPIRRLVASRRAKALGYAIHFAFGLAFALVYLAIFAAIEAASWWFGALLGVVDALFAGSALVNVLLPLVHPALGTSATAANTRVPCSSRPVFMLLNYGRPTPLVALVAPVAYGAVIGAFVSLA